jgi:hypothetical protein
MWVDIGTSERFRPLGRFRRGTKTEHALPHSPHPQPLAAILTEKREDVAYRQTVSFLRKLRTDNGALRANCFALRIASKLTVFRYAINIFPF